MPEMSLASMLPDDRYTVFLIMPATLSNASAAAAAVPYSDCVGRQELLPGVFAYRKTRPVATINIVAHAEAMKRPLRRHRWAAPRPAKLLSIPPVARHRQGHFSRGRQGHF